MGISRLIGAVVFVCLSTAQAAHYVSPRLHLRYENFAVATAGQVYDDRIRVTVTSNGSDGIPDVPVILELPGTGPSATFPGGGLVYAGTTDAYGSVLAPPMRSNAILGQVIVKIRTPEAETTFESIANVGPTRLEVVGTGTRSTSFPGIDEAFATVTFIGYPCAPANLTGRGWGPTGVRVLVESDGIAIAEGSMDDAALSHGCKDGHYAKTIRAQTPHIGFGIHRGTVSYPGTAVYEAAAPIEVSRIEVLPHATGMAGGRAWKAGAVFHDLPYPNPLQMTPTTGAPPPGMTLVAGAYRYLLESGANVRSRVVMEFDEAIPREARAMWFGALAGETQPSWRELPTTVEGNRVQFIVTKGALGDSLLADAQRVGGEVAIAMPLPGTAPGFHQDLWWGSPSQNGWGLGIAQHGNRMFVTLYAYDEAGNPRWWVVPGGEWSGDFKTFTGAAYSPRWGTLPRGYGGMIAGAPVGNISLEFSGGNSATMRFKLGEHVGERKIERQPIGLISPAVHWSNADMWWYGQDLNGIGMFLAQQGGTMFGVRYTYDFAAGSNTWQVLPGGYWRGTKKFAAPGWYSTTGSNFFSGYDPAALKVQRLNSASFKFDEAKADRAVVDLGFFVGTSDYGQVIETIERQPF